MKEPEYCKGGTNEPYNGSGRPKPPSGSKVRNMIRDENDEKYRYQSKKRLMLNISKKFTTTMIGAIAAIEKRFGHIWENDPRWINTWEDTRKEILDIGNKNLRAAEQEISEYSVSWDRHDTVFLHPNTYNDLTKKENRHGD